MKKLLVGLITILSMGAFASVTVEVTDGGVYGHKLRKIEGTIENATNKAKLALFNHCGIEGIQGVMRVQESKCSLKKQSHREIKVNVCEIQGSASCNEASSELVSAIGKDGGVKSYKEIKRDGSLDKSYGKAYSQLVKKCEDQGKALSDDGVSKMVSFCSNEVQGSKNQIVKVCTTGLKATCK